MDYRAAIDVNTPEDMLNDLTTECLLNKSLGLVETEILLGINRQLKTSLKDVPHLNWFSVRNQLLGLFASGSWKKSVPYANLQVPKTWFPELRRLATETRDEIDVASRAKLIELLGSSNCLFEEGL